MQAMVDDPVFPMFTPRHILKSKRVDSNEIVPAIRPQTTPPRSKSPVNAANQYHMECWRSADMEIGGQVPWIIRCPQIRLTKMMPMDRGGMDICVERTINGKFR